MADPWALTVAVLALLGQAPNFIGNWESFIKRLRERRTLSELEVKESEITLLGARADWLTHKTLLLDLVIAFSKEHTMNPQVVEFCKTQRPQIFNEFQEVREKLLKLTDSNDTKSEAS